MTDRTQKNSAVTPLEAYFAAYDAHLPYRPDSGWQEAFENVARRVSNKIQPGSVLDVGCAYGVLVERLRAHGIEAYGIDVDPFAIDQIPHDIRPFCWQSSFSDPLPRRYDLIISLETLKRLEWSEAQAAIANLCQYTDDILFAVTPFNFKGTSTRSPYPPEDWTEVFAQYNFYRDFEFVIEPIAPWAIRFRRSTKELPAAIRDYERRYWLNYREIQDLRTTITDTRADLIQKELEITHLTGQTAELLALRQEVQMLTRQVNEMSTQILDWHNHWTAIQNSRSWRLFKALQRVQPRLAPEGSRRLMFLKWAFEVTRNTVRQLRGESRAPLLEAAQGATESNTSAHELDGLTITPKTLEPLKISLYSSDPWTAACVHLRVVGPSNYAGSGIQVLEGIRWAEAQPLLFPDEAQAVLIQRDFPRHEAYYQQVIDWARLTHKPIIYEIDDLLTELPDEHPEKDYYKDIRQGMLDAMHNADAVIVSTLALAEYTRLYNPNTWVLPNYLDDRIWRLEPRNHVRKQIPLVIGYMGGITKTHLPDLALVTPLLQRLLMRYKDRIRLRFWGVCPPELEGLSNVEFPNEKFPNYLEFARFFSQQDCGLFIAPLRDNKFNRSKSSIKFLEYSSLGIPCVYSRIAPYEQVVKNGWNGFLAGDEFEWEDCLTRLIEDTKLRQELGKAAYHTINTNWRMSQHAHEWGTIYGAALACRTNL